MNLTFAPVGAGIAFLFTLAASVPTGAQDLPDDSTAFPVLFGPYLGQEEPGLTPVPFAQGLFARPLGLAIPPGGEEGWTRPVTAPFSGVYMDWDINISPDGHLLRMSLAGREVPVLPQDRGDREGCLLGGRPGDRGAERENRGTVREGDQALVFLRRFGRMKEGRPGTEKGS